MREPYIYADCSFNRSWPSGSFTDISIATIKILNRACEIRDTWQRIREFVNLTTLKLHWSTVRSVFQIAYMVRSRRKLPWYFITWVKLRCICTAHSGHIQILSWKSFLQCRSKRRCRKSPRNNLFSQMALTLFAVYYNRYVPGDVNVNFSDCAIYTDYMESARSKLISAMTA